MLCRYRESSEDSSVIMAKTHHRSIRTAARYIKPGLAAVTKATERLDPPHDEADRP
jgi:hypothetical protein